MVSVLYFLHQISWLYEVGVNCEKQQIILERYYNYKLYDFSIYACVGVSILVIQILCQLMRVEIYFVRVSNGIEVRKWWKNNLLLLHNKN